jgi:hypothetical protein
MSGLRDGAQPPTNNKVLLLLLLGAGQAGQTSSQRQLSSTRP